MLIDQALAFLAWRLEAWAVRMMDLRLPIPVRDAWEGRR